MEPRYATPRDIPDYLLDLQADDRVSALEARRIIFEALKRTAERGDECPNFEILNELCNYSSSSSSPYQVRQLEASGKISVIRYQRSRVVEITSTGHRTKASRETLPHWRARGSIQRVAEGA